MNFHLQILNREFDKRRAKNARYSLRAYASFLGLHPSALSRVLATKQLLSPRSGLAVVRKLGLDSEESRRFLQSIVEDRRTRESTRMGAVIEAPLLRPKQVKIEADVYRQIARVPCLALLALTLVEGFQSDNAWIAAQLGISVDEAKTTVDLLLSIGLLKIVDGRYVNSNEHMTAIENEETNQIRKDLQAEIVHRSGMALDLPFEKRAHYGMTMAIDPSKIDEARKRIMEFMEALSDELESGNRTQVYQLGVQLFPLSTGTAPQAN